RVALLHEPAPRRVLPLGLGRQPKPRPLAKRLCVRPGGVNDGVIHPLVDRRLRALGMAPARPEYLSPPWRLGDAAGVRELIGEQTAEDKGPAIALGVGDVACVIHELSEPLI